MTPAILNLLRQHASAEAYRQLPPEELCGKIRTEMDEVAFRVFLERTGSRVYQRCRVILRDDHQAEEAFQDTYRDLIRKRDRIPSYLQAASWVYETARRHARYRRYRNWLRVFRERTHPVAVAIESGTQQVDTSEDVARLLAQLPQKFRQPIELVFWHGLTHPEVARALGLPKGTVAARVSRGLAKLRVAAARLGLPAITIGALQAQSVYALNEGQLEKLAQSAWQAGSASVESGLIWPSGKATVAVSIVAGALALSGVWWVMSTPRSEPVPSKTPTAGLLADLPPNPETLQARNLRILTDEVLPRFRAQYQQTMPANNPIASEHVRVQGSAVEVVMRPTRAVANFFPAGLRIRFCTFRRTLRSWELDVQSGQWRERNIRRPLVTHIRNPLAPFVPLVQTTPGEVDARWTAVRHVFEMLPTDLRAEAEHLRFLFGPLEGEFVLPVNSNVSHHANGFLAHSDGHGLYARGTDGRWRYTGECFGWRPVVTNERVYCTGYGQIRSRLLSEPHAPWVVECDEPPVQPGEEGLHYRVLQDHHLYLCKQHVAWVRPLGPNAQWVRIEMTTWTGGVTVAAGQFYGAAGGRVYVSEFPKSGFRWRDLGPAAPDGTSLLADGPRILAYNQDRPGPIYARSLDSGPDDPWVIVGRVHDPNRP